MCSPNDDWASIGHYRAANAALSGTDSRRVVFMGDSVTEAWRSQPFIKDNPAFVGRGISGQTAPQMLVRFHADVIALRPAVVHIMAGTNDIAKNTGPETDVEIQGYLTSMISLARVNGISVVLASIPPAADYDWHRGLDPAPRIKRLNAWAKEYAARNSLVYVDYWTVLATPEGGMKEGFSADGVHPNAAGYSAMQPLARAAIELALRST